MQVSETVELRGHMIDSGVLTRALDDIREYGGDYVIDRFDVGKDHDDESYARDRRPRRRGGLQRLVMRLQTHGVNPPDPGEVVAARGRAADGVFPDDFYSTTNLETVVRIGGHWVPVEHPEMDCGLVVTGDRARDRPRERRQARRPGGLRRRRREGRAAAGDRPQPRRASSS